MTAPPCPNPEVLARDQHVCLICGHWCGRECERPFAWNPRYYYYAVIVHDSIDLAAVLAKDAEAYPGGRMTPFVVWCRKMVNEWVGETKHWGKPLDHKAFDGWLKRQVNWGKFDLARKAREAK